MHLRGALPTSHRSTILCSDCYWFVLHPSDCTSVARNKLSKTICMADIKCKHSRSLYHWSPGSIRFKQYRKQFLIFVLLISMISAMTVVARPAEIYSYGWLIVLPYPVIMLLLVISTNYFVLPVYHQCGVDNCYAVSTFTSSVNNN